jgi:hypothetical protein
LVILGKIYNVPSKAVDSVVLWTPPRHLPQHPKQTFYSYRNTGWLGLRKWVFAEFWTVLAEMAFWNE